MSLCEFIGCGTMADRWIKMEDIARVYLCSIHERLLVALRRKYQFLERGVPQFRIKWPFLRHDSIAQVAQAIQLRKHVYGCLMDGNWKQAFSEAIDILISILSIHVVLPTHNATNICAHQNCAGLGNYHIRPWLFGNMFHVTFCYGHAKQMGMLYFASKATESLIPAIFDRDLQEVAIWQMKMDHYSFHVRLKKTS
jgi:hypothetical protein